VGTVRNKFGTTSVGVAGFVLLELLIAILISSFITLGLFTGFLQLRSALQSVDYETSLYQRATLVYEQFERDLSGAFKPVSNKKDEPATDKAKQPRPEKTEEKKEQPLTHIFYGSNKDKNLEVLTCITANPLQIYWSDKVGEAKPRMVRTVYRLIKEQGEPISYRMMRQEAYAPLSWEAFAPQAAKPIRLLEVITGIKECTVRYTAVTEKKSEGAQAEKKKTKEYEYKESKEWREPKKEEKAAQEKKEQQKEIPDFVTMKLVLWDDTKTRDMTFEFTWAVGRAIFNDFEPDKEEPEKQEKKPGEMPQTKQEMKQRFVDNMNKIKAIQEDLERKRAAFRDKIQALDRAHMLAQKKRSTGAGPRLAHNGTGRAVQAFGTENITGKPTSSFVSNMPQNDNNAIVRTGDWMPPENVAYVDDYPPDWMYDLPPEVQERMIAYYSDMPAQAVDWMG
jgi:type II secretory pathway pseudopilin PulG